MDGYLVDARYVAVELLAEELSSFRVTEEIPCKQCGSITGLESSEF